MLRRIWIYIHRTCALEVNKLLLLLLLYLSDRPGESIPRKKNIVGYSQVRFYKLRAVTRAVIVRVGVKWVQRKLSSNKDNL